MPTSIIDWATTELCTYSDLIKETRGLDKMLDTTEAAEIIY